MTIRCSNTKVSRATCTENSKYMNVFALHGKMSNQMALCRDNNGIFFKQIIPQNVLNDTTIDTVYGSKLTQNINNVHKCNVMNYT